MDVISRACAVYCSGSLLHSVQMLQIFNDSKTFVDAPMRHDPEIILDLWQAVEDKTNRSAVADFVIAHVPFTFALLIALQCQEIVAHASSCCKHGFDECCGL